MKALLLTLMTSLHQSGETLPPPEIPEAIWDAHAAALCSSDALPIPGELPIPLQRAIERFSVKHQLWDGSGWNWASNTSGEISWVRNHLWLGYPSLDDLKRFPAPEEVKRRLDDGKSHGELLEKLAALMPHRRVELAEMMSDYYIAIAPWMRLYAAQTHKGANKTLARAELSALKVLIGEDAYQAGLLPLHIPPSHYVRK